MRDMLLVWPLLLVGCGGGDDDKGRAAADSAADADADTDTDTDTDTDADTDADVEGRAFLMGATPWPYEASWEAITRTYERIHNHGDFVAHHLDGGVPWPEALAGSEYAAAVNEELDTRLALTDPLLPAYVALSPLSIGRDDLALYWGESVNMARPGDWATATFADPDVRTAYARWSLDVVAHFDPTWLNYGIEASDYLYRRPEAWDAFVGFAQHVHDAIKAEHPDVQLMVSVALKHPDDPASATIRERLPELLPYVDVLGVSVYPYAFFGLEDGGNPANLPEDWLAQVSDIAPDHPVAIAETGWIAQDLVVDAGSWSLDVQSTPEWQAEYVQALCTQANALDAQFITWWTVTDFDTLWETTLGSDPLAAIWRATGLYSAGGDPRPALEVWDAWHDRPLAD